MQRVPHGGGHTGMAKPKTPPWKRPKPAKSSTPLSEDDKRAARQRAERAGRRYPNLVDNMWAAARARRKAAE